MLFFLISSYRRKQHKKFIVYLPSFPQCNHLGPRVLANGGRSLSVFHFTLQSVYQWRMSFLHSKTSWACQKWMTRKNRWGYLWTSSQIVVRWRYTLTFPPRDRLHRIVWFLILYTFPLIGKSGEKCLPSKHYSPKRPLAPTKDQMPNFKPRWQVFPECYTLTLHLAIWSWPRWSLTTKR